MSLEEAENGIRDMFLDRQYNGTVPLKDVNHILKSERWERMYGKGNVRKAWDGLVADNYVEKRGNSWFWSSYDEKDRKE